MRVAMYYSNDDVRLEELPVPTAGPGELLMRVRASGICGTDVLEWYRRKQAPRVLGHEVTGEVTEVGDGVTGFAPGDRIVTTHHVPCNECHHCLSGHASVCQLMRETHFDPGGFAEYLRLPKVNVDSGTFLLPDSLSFEQGSFVEPLGCAVRAQDHARAPLQENVLVIGTGIAGLLHVQVARSRGIKTLVATDINEERLRLARSLGAHHTFHATDDVPAHLREACGGRLADLVIVCTGAAPGDPAGVPVRRARRQAALLRLHSRRARGAHAAVRDVAGRGRPRHFLWCESAGSEGCGGSVGGRQGQRG